MKFINIGRIAKAHGVRGEMALDFYAEDPGLLDGILFLGAPGSSGQTTAASLPAGSGQARLSSLRWHHGKPLIMLEGVTDRTGAEALRGRHLYIPESALPELSDAELYLHAIIGFKVYVTGVRLAGVNETEPLGELAWVEQSSGQEIWGIVTPDGKEALFPAVDEFIVGFDMENESVRIAPPEGLLELYLSDQ